MLAETDFIPPMPVMRDRKVGAIAGLLRLRRDILSSFMRESFQREVMNVRGFGRTLLVVNQPELVREVFIARHDVYERRSQFQRRMLGPVMGSSVFISDGPMTMQRRAVLARLLHPSRVPGFFDLYVEAAAELAAEWASDEPVDRRIEEGFAIAAARVMLRKLFGHGAPLEAARIISQDFTALQDAAAPVDALYVLGVSARLTGFHTRRARNLAASIRREVLAMMRAWKPADGGIYGEMLAAKGEDGQPLMNEAELVDETAGLLLAGSETTAKVMPWAFWILAAHRPSMVRAQRELAEVLGGRAPVADDLARLPFLKAVLHETMRLYPPVPVLARQAMKPDRIRRWELKPGDMVMASPWLLHRNPRHWEEPDAFRPDRFLGDWSKRVTRFSYVPFSLGARVCAGAAIAMGEMTAFLAVLLQKLEMSAIPGAAPIPRARLTLLTHEGMRLKIGPRA